MAVNCWVVPFATVGLVGVTAMASSVAAVISNVVCAVAAPNTTLMFVVPTATLVASPWLPAVLLIVANPVLLDVQVASVVTSCVELSEKVAMAANDCTVPLGMLGASGVIPTLTNEAPVTVSELVPVMPLTVA